MTGRELKRWDIRPSREVLERIAQMDREHATACQAVRNMSCGSDRDGLLRTLAQIKSLAR